MARYMMREMPDLNETGERKLYPRMSIDWVADLDMLAARISRRSTFTPADIIGVVTALSEVMAEYLAEGFGVKVNGLGSFSPSLGLREGFAPEGLDSEHKRNAMSISVRGVRFRAEKSFVRAVDARCHLERGGRQVIRSRRFTPEQRQAMALAYLETNAYLTVRSYMQMTGLAQSSATRELRRWYESDIIDAIGMYAQRKYIKKRTEPSE